MKKLVNLSLAFAVGSGSIIGYVIWRNRREESMPPPNSVVTSLVPAQQRREESEELKLQAKKQQTREEADRIFQKINDYSFRLFSPCGMGTAWILDYQLPEDGHYPTVWYIATVAHTIRRFRFTDNTYNQELSISIENTNKLREEVPQQDFSKLSLYGNWEKNCELSARQGYFDFNLSRQENGEELQTEFGAIHNNKIKTPKLFYTSIDLWETNSSLNIPKNNYKDFAVLEIEFNDEKYARKATGNFAEKYPVSVTNALNIFSGPLDSRYSWEEIEKLDENFYNLSYSSKPKVLNKYNYTISFDREKAEAFKLSNDPKNWYKTAKKKLNGHVASKGLWEFKWNGKKKVDMGHHYLLKIDKELRMGVGASGSLYADKNGNVLGLHGGGEFWGEHSFVIPLRSNGISLEGTIQAPKYDLILGTDGQTSSYKQQVERYNKNTWLRARDWKHKSWGILD